MSLDLLSKIDLVLEWLYLHSGENQTFESIKAGIAGYAIEEGEVDDCLKKLHKDGFLYFIEKDSGSVVDFYYRRHNFLITFDGKFFFETTRGYRENTNRLNDKEDATDALIERTEKNEERLVKWTKNLTYGTVAIVLWELLRFFLFEGHWKFFSCH